LTLRKWLQTPEFRALLAEEAIEPVVQAATAVVRWAPAAVARLIRDLDSESPNDARRAAREILRLAMEVQKHLSPLETPKRKEPAKGKAAALDGGMDPLSRRVEALTEEEMEAIWRVLNGPAEDARSPAAGGEALPHAPSKLGG